MRQPSWIRVLPALLLAVGQACSAPLATPQEGTPLVQPASSALPAGEPTFPGVPLPAGDGPSVVSPPAQGSDGVLGFRTLARNREAVVDGDTIRVEDLDASLRLVGIDTEEVFHEAGDRRLALTNWEEYLTTQYAGHDPARPPKFGTFMGEAARDFAKRFFSGDQRVFLVQDDALVPRGYFGRHLVHVLVPRGERWVDYNVEVVRQGLSPYFVKYGAVRRWDAAFRAAEDEARALRRGIWADPRPYPGYADYAARLAWWREREAAIGRVTARAGSDPELVLLGRPDAMTRLTGLVGKQVRVAGAPGEPRAISGGRILLPLAHRQNEDLLIVGTTQEIEALGLAAENGNVLYVTGTVSLYRGRPQFAASSVRWERP